MFEFLRKKQPKEVVENSPSVGLNGIPATSMKYGKDIQTIHHAFYTASDKLLKEAEDFLEEAKNVPVDKINRLKATGFKQAGEVSKHEPTLRQAELSQEQKDSLMEYRIKYPNYKFINEAQVQAICFKYGLVCGNTSLYKGFVPEKNLKDIETFLKIEGVSDMWEDDGNGNVIDMSNYEIFSSSGRHEHFFPKGSDKRKDWRESAFQSNMDGRGFYASGIVDGVDYSIDGYLNRVTPKICAPIKDMDMTGMTVEKGYKIKKIVVEDPVVLQPVKNGYLIITAWGDEASDELVVNQQMN